LAVLIVIFETSCFWDSSKSKNNSLLWLILLNSSDSSITIKGSSYNNAGVLQFYGETVYPSASTCLQSLQNDINGAIFPTVSERGNLGGQISTKMSSAIGADGVWFTGDDTVFICTELKVISPTISRYITYSNFTGTAADYYEYQFDATGRVIKRTYFNGKGPDTTWFTGDDLKAKDSDNVAILNATWSDNNNCTSIGYDTDGVTITQQFTVKRDTAASTITYKKFQSDGTTQVSANVFDYTNNRIVAYSTSMSVIIIYATNTLNSSKEEVTSTLYGGAGVDNNWFTDDDQILLYIESTYDPGGYPTGLSAYTDKTKTNRTGYITITH